MSQIKLKIRLATKHSKFPFSFVFKPQNMAKEASKLKFLALFLLDFLFHKKE